MYSTFVIFTLFSVAIIHGMVVTTQKSVKAKLSIKIVTDEKVSKWFPSPSLVHCGVGSSVFPFARGCCYNGFHCITLFHPLVKYSATGTDQGWTCWEFYSHLSEIADRLEHDEKDEKSSPATPPPTTTISALIPVFAAPESDRIFSGGHYYNSTHCTTVFGKTVAISDEYSADVECGPKYQCTKNGFQRFDRYPPHSLYPTGVDSCDADGDIYSEAFGCISIGTTSLSWCDARRECFELGGDLFSAMNDTQNLQMINFLKSKSVTVTMWILTSLKEHTPIWPLSGLPIMNEWKPHYSMMEDLGECVYMKPGSIGSLAMKNCEESVAVSLCVAKITS